MNLLAAVTAGRRARNPYARRGWLRVSRRLACGLTPHQVAVAERTDEAAIEGLLAQEGFREVVAAYEDFLSLPPADAMAKLVRLARMALENALSDWDLGATLFVLREDKLDRDAAETLAKGVLATSRRKPAATAAAPPSAATDPPPPGTRPCEPGLRLLDRGAARLRRAVIEEHAVQRAAGVGPGPVGGGADTVAAARKALAAKAAAPTSPAQRLARQLNYGTGLSAPTPHGAPAPRPSAPAQPRRPRPP
jgi:hypothetical protein